MKLIFFPTSTMKKGKLALNEAAQRLGKDIDIYCDYSLVIRHIFKSYIHKLFYSSFRHTLMQQLPILENEKNHFLNVCRFPILFILLLFNSSQYLQKN